MEINQTESWTSADLDRIPDTRWAIYEIIDGELHVSKAPGIPHQLVLGSVQRRLEEWNEQNRRGKVIPGPGLLFAEDKDVIPDLIWISHERMAQITGADAKLHGPPELVVEILSPGKRNIERDQVTKLRLYNQQKVDEYWVVDPMNRMLTIFSPYAPMMEFSGSDEVTSGFLGLTIFSPYAPLRFPLESIWD